MFLYSMKIKDQTRKLAAGCSKHCFEVVNRTDEVSSKHCFEVVNRTDEVSSKHCFEVADRTDEVSNIYLRQDEADVVLRDFRRVLFGQGTHWIPWCKHNWFCFIGSLFFCCQQFLADNDLICVFVHPSV